MNFEIKAFGILTFTAWLSFIRQYRHITAMRKFIEIIVSIYASIGIYILFLLTTCVMFITVKANSMYFDYELFTIDELAFEQYKSMFSGFKIGEDANFFQQVIYIMLTVIQVLVMFNLLISIVGDTRS